MVHNDTTYKDGTPDAVVNTLERFRQDRSRRIRVYYGDAATGLAWGDTEAGYIGRSMGPEKVPLMIVNRRSMGGGAILTHCIVKIEHANKANGGVIWKHPAYHEDAEHPIYITR